MESTHEARIAVLEKLSENCDQQREDTLKRIEQLESRFDEHITATAAVNLKMVEAVTTVAGEVKGIRADLQHALHGSILAVKHETIAQALLWVGAGLVTLAGGGWAVFTFVMGH